jgi:hypothetical protein
MKIRFGGADRGGQDETRRVLVAKAGPGIAVQSALAANQTDGNNAKM